MWHAVGAEWMFTWSDNEGAHTCHTYLDTDVRPGDHPFSALANCSSFFMLESNCEAWVVAQIAAVNRGWVRVKQRHQVRLATAGYTVVCTIIYIILKTRI
eukprot:COSAG01_NODE_4088_length_5358_cov_2.162804_5_plen_100_part_00